MIDDTSLPFVFPAVGRKKVTAAFDGGRITSDGGVMLLAEAERRLGLAGKLAAVIPDHRDPGRTVHALADILRARIFAIACGWEDADDHRSVIRLGRVMLDLWLDSYPEANGVDYLFGLPGNRVLDRLIDRLIDAAADDVRTRRALEQKPCLRGFAATGYRAKSWKRERRACARIEATTRGLDIRFVVTNPEAGSAEHVYAVLYCARGQAENLIKLHKSQLASDRTSCRSPPANQARLFLHTAAYWLMLTLRDAIPTAHPLAVAEFTTLRLKLLKIGARVIETASRVRLAFAAACPDAALVRHRATALAGP